MTPRIAHLLPHAPSASELDLMRQLLGHAGLSLDEQDMVVWSTPDEVATKLAAMQPTLCLLWEQHGHMLRAMRGEKKCNIDDWRGSVWMASQVCPGVKCIATYHPARIRVEWRLTGIARFDIKRVSEEAKTLTFTPPQRNIRVLLPASTKASEICAILDGYRQRLKPISFDLEGVCNWITCYSIADSSTEAIVVPIIYSDGQSVWDEEDELAIWQATEALLEDPLVPKILQNHLYDSFVLAWSYGIVIQGLQDDTMLKTFELMAEMEKGLAFQASIYTKEPFYKAERKSTDEMTQLIYCGKDACVTFECNEVMDKRLQPQQRKHYEWNVQLLAPLLYMMLRGMRFDGEQARKRLQETQHEIYELQHAINKEAASGRPVLQQFYSALGASQMGEGVDSCRMASGFIPTASAPMGLLGTRHGSDLHQPQLSSLLPLLQVAFCKASPRVRGEVTTTTWQPYHRNKKGKWVRKGKRVTSKDYPGVIWDTEVSPEEAGFKVTDQRDIWLKPIHTTKECNLPAKIETLEAVQQFSKDSCDSDCRRAIQLVRGILKTGTASLAQCGELSTLLGIHLNVGSTAQGGDSQWFLYQHCGLPQQFIKEGNKNTTKLASDDLAIVKAWVQSGKTDETRDGRALTFLKLRRALTQTKFLVAKPDDDGRIRSSINLVATPTCRMAMYGSPTGTSDLNMQTIGKGLRDLFPAPEGSFIYQKDLDGSDSWGVAAYCALVGDDTMLLDNKAKLKPAKILACIYENGPAVNQLTREQLKVECAKVDGEGWLYFACKRVLHGSDYGMGKVTMANQILTDSYKLLGNPVWLEPAACERIQRNAFFVRYPGVQRWHKWMAQEIRTAGQLVASTGFARRIFGRKDEHGTLKECLSHFPQYYTTYSIKCTLISPQGLPRQWTDPENRREDGSLRIEPLLLVHDSNVGQAPLTDLEFSRRKLTEWFQNPVTIANLTLTIPASSTWGLDWKNQNNQL